MERQSTLGRKGCVRLLIAADRPADAAAIRDVLATAGSLFRFEVVDSPEELRRRIAEESIDAVVCRHPLRNWAGCPPTELLGKAGEQIPTIMVGDVAAGDTAAEMTQEGVSGLVVSTGMESLPWALCRVLHQKSQGEEERLQRELAIGASKEWNLTFDTVSESVMVLDTQHRIRRANRATAALLGVKIEQIQGKACFEVIHGTDAPPKHCPLQRMLQTRKTERIDVEEPRLGRTFDVIANPLFDPAGALMGCVHVVRDITERARAERALRQSEEKYRAFFQQNLAGNYISRAEGQLLDCNTAFLEMFGFTSRNEAKDFNMKTLYVDASARERFVRKLEAQGHVEHEEKELRRRDGRRLIVRENALGVRDAQGRLTEIRGFLVNETERRRAEMELRQTQKMESLGRLAAGVAHDFNNLLTVIIGFSEVLMQDADLSENMRANVAQIREAGRHGARLTRQLLAFSRKQVLSPVLMDLNHAIAALEMMMSRLLPENIELRMRLEPGLAGIHADPGQIEQVILNLAINARDAMPKGGELTLDTSHLQVDEAFAREHAPLRPGSYVRLTISDNGVGMDKATKAQIFEPFFTTKEPEKGTGLGLATVYGIVEQSGGHIWVESEVGMGATFTVLLPAAQAIAQPEMRHIPRIEPRGRAETILLVEDAAAVRNLTGVLLRREGYVVLEAASSAEAMRVAERHAGPIHLLLTDVVMPESDGTALAERLMACRREMRVLYATGCADDVVLNRIAEAAGRVLSKPFSAEELSRAVRQVLDAATDDASIDNL